MNKTRETPLSTIKTILKVHKHEEELRFTRENLKKAEKLLPIAFIEFYQKLGHLKNYSFLNTSAISKIIKKYDKVFFFFENWLRMIRYFLLYIYQNP